MPFTETDLKTIEDLAYLTSESDDHQLFEEVNAIMDFVEQLRKEDTTAVDPLFHPFDDLKQRLREDQATEKDSSTELAEIAPLFEDGLYLVPKVIDSGQ